MTTIHVRATPLGTAVTLLTGAGDDHVIVGSVSNTLDDIRGPLSISGQGQALQDVLTLNDHGSPLAHTYVVNRTQVTRDSVVIAAYVGIERLVLNPSLVPGTIVWYILTGPTQFDLWGAPGGGGGGGFPERPPDSGGDLSDLFAPAEDGFEDEIMDRIAACRPDETALAAALQGLWV